MRDDGQTGLQIGGEARVAPEDTHIDELMAMEQVLWCPNGGQPVRISLEECERRRADGDPECTNPTNQLGGYHFCLDGHWKRRVFWVEPPKDGYTLHIRFEKEG